MLETTVVITTIGRPTLTNSIKSALNENFKVIVVADGIVLPEELLQFKSEQVKFFKTGKKYGFYGSIPLNVGTYMAETEFISQLSDDDEIISGKGQVIRDAINNDPSTDIWIPGMIANNKVYCIKNDFIEGNVGSPTLRTNVMACCPIRHPSKEEWENIDEGLDFWHIREAVKMGFKLRWIGEPILSIRPLLTGHRGYGKPEVNTHTHSIKQLL